MKIHAGLMRHTVTVQTVNPGDDFNSGPAWSDSFSVAAAINPKTGREAVETDKVEGRTPIVVVVRYRDDITEANRLIHQNRVWNILEVVNDEQRDRWLVITAVDARETV